VESPLLQLNQGPLSDPAQGRAIRVLLDGRKLGDGGIGVYIRNLITGLSALKGVDITVLTSQSRQGLIPKGMSVVVDEAKNYSLNELFLMPRRLDLAKYDVWHSPHFMLPFGLEIPSVVTIHDTIHLDFPERWIHTLVAKNLIKSAMHRADRILTVSNASKDSLANLTANIKSKIEVVPNAIAEAFIKPNKSASGINGPYFLGVFSNTKQHKGLGDLLIAYDAVREELGGLQLVLVGSGLTDENPDLHQFAEILARPEVTILGEISESWLRALYAGADFLAAPSLAEGFGLPVLEAKSQGTPILSRPTPAILELLDEEDIVCSDDTIEELAQGIIEAREKFFNREKLVNPKIDLDKFSTTSTATRVLEVYKSALLGKQKGPK
jgi:glycosyltransferase involved in cell wall biosynthesis